MFKWSEIIEQNKGQLISTLENAYKEAVDNLIRDTLWAELPECYDEVSISGYRQKIYEYVYTRYPDVA